MRITIKHYYSFDSKETALNLRQPSGWDRLRTSSSGDKAFAIPTDRNRWIEQCLKDKALDARAEAITRFIAPAYTKINSFGVGGACLEYLLKIKNPKIYLQCSDFGYKTIERLKEVFTESNGIERFDMRQDAWVNTGKGNLYLLHRIDTEFSDNEWQVIFSKMQAAGIQDILFIPCGILTLSGIVYHLLKHFYYKILNRRAIFAGYLRTEDQLKFNLAPFYQIEKTEVFGDLKGFLLKLKN